MSFKGEKPDVDDFRREENRKNPRTAREKSSKVRGDIS